MNEAELLSRLGSMIRPDVVEQAYNVERRKMAARLRATASIPTSLQLARNIIALNIRENIRQHYGKARAGLRIAAKMHAKRGAIPALCVLARALQYVAAIPATPEPWRAAAYVQGLHMFLALAAEAQKSPFEAERAEAVRALEWLMLQTEGDACGLKDANPGDRAMLDRRPIVLRMRGEKEGEKRPSIADRLDAIRVQIELSGVEVMQPRAKAREAEAERA